MTFPCENAFDVCFAFCKDFEPKNDSFNVVNDVDAGVNIATSVDADLASCCLSLSPLHDDMVETGLLAIDGPAKSDTDPKADLDMKNKASVFKVRLELAG